MLKERKIWGAATDERPMHDDDEEEEEEEGRKADGYVQVEILNTFGHCRMFHILQQVTLHLFLAVVRLRAVIIPGGSMHSLPWPVFFFLWLLDEMFFLTVTFIEHCEVVPVASCSVHVTDSWIYLMTLCLTSRSYIERRIAVRLSMMKWNGCEKKRP